MEIKKAKELANIFGIILCVISLSSFSYNEQIGYFLFTVFLIFLYSSSVYLGKRKDYEIVDWLIIKPISRNMSAISAVWILAQVLFAGKLGFPPLALAFFIVFSPLWITAIIKSSQQQKVPAQVFLSYAHADHPTVRDLFQNLSNEGLRPWMDSENIIPGSNWDLEIRRAIFKSDFFIVCLSRHSFNRQGVIQEEIDTALRIWNSRGKDEIFLIPVFLEDCEMPSKLKALQGIHLRSEDGFQRLLKAINVGLKRRTK